MNGSSLRVLHVLEAVGGGTMRHLEDLVAHVPAQHHVACPPRRATDLSHAAPVAALQSRGASVHELHMSRRVRLQTARAVTRLRGIVEQVQPDVVHAHASVAGVLARLAVGGRVPVIWTPHAVSDRLSVRLVERRLPFQPVRVVALSDSEAALIRQSRLAPASRIRVIPNGLERRLAGGSDKEFGGWPVPPGTPVLGFVGRLSRQKDPVAFVKVAARVLAARGDVHAVCVGSGELLSLVLEQARAELPRGRFHHAVCDEDAEALLPLMSVLVMPSLYEGGPYLPLEAALAGVPVVATRCVGLRDYVVNGVSGLTTLPGDVVGMAEAALSLFESDLARRLADSATAHVAKEHSLSGMVARYVDLYASVIASPA